MTTSIGTPNELLRKAYHDVKNPLANLILLTEINDKSTADLIPVIKTVNNELWKIVYKLEMLQLLTQSLPNNETIKNEIRIDELIDEVIESFYKTDHSSHITMSLASNIEASQLLMAADSDSLTRLLSFILRQLHISNPTAHWHINVLHTAEGLKIIFSKNNNPATVDACEWLTSFNNHWEWLAAQKIAKQYKLELNVAYNNHYLSCVMLAQAV